MPGRKNPIEILVFEGVIQVTLKLKGTKPSAFDRALHTDALLALIILTDLV